MGIMCVWFIVPSVFYSREKINFKPTQKSNPISITKICPYSPAHFPTNSHNFPIR